MQKGDLVRLTRSRDYMYGTDKAAQIFERTYDDMALVTSAKPRGWSGKGYDIELVWLADGEGDGGSSLWFEKVETDDGTV